MNKMAVVSVCMAACSVAFAQGRDDFMRQQAYAEMQRVSGQVDVLQSNLGELQNRVGRLEGGGDTRALRQEIDALKASVAEIRREMRNMHGEIVKELSAKFAVMLKTVTPPAPPPAPRQPPKPSYTGPCKEYVVEGGDTLSVIAEAFGTTVPKLREMNNLKGDRLSIGQKLLVPKK
ncbi:MAG: LysM peptidoglycan-binding domain-containing protein [Kiritimatiellae bacterium]|nr:LysM peptidoglycan-binding domain-containing protein [Kiritimatiellia bacterium]